MENSPCLYASPTLVVRHFRVFWEAERDSCHGLLKRKWHAFMSTTSHAKESW